MRPHLHRLATEIGLAGHVGNDATGVFCEVEGPAEGLDMFVRRAVEAAPPLAVVESVVVAERPPTGQRGFVIVPSAPGRSDAAPVALVPADSATCAACLSEMADPTDRRYRYPFIACTFCGPRFTIVRGVPYDRPFTTMDAFPLCAQCQAEFDDPTDRRFHAQPTACPVCGPQLWWQPADVDGRVSTAETAPVRGDAALAQAMSVLADGGVVAVKGIGGYHLACDARRAATVARLRRRKARARKPFALLARDLEVVRRLVRTDETTEQALASPAAPIVLAPLREEDAESRRLRDAVAPGQSSLGLMLPPSGLHHLLLSEHPTSGAPPSDLLVLTSANLSDEPICTDQEEAERRLADIADGWLHHDRSIHLACDDSVVRLVVDPVPPTDETGAGRAPACLQPVRRSRGYAPVPVRLPFDSPPVLAVGGELKATICLAEGHRAWLSQHLGDVASLEALALLERTVDVLAAQSRITPAMVVADLHPGYLSRRWAAQRAESTGVALVGVQHHHAHLAALLAEHGRPVDDPVLGVTFDGTGYGLDGTIWGGEVLLGSYRSVRRVAHLRPIRLPGGDAAIRHPSRVALAHLDAAALPWAEHLPAVAATAPSERRLLHQMLKGGAGCVPTTSMGRLFDGVAALVGVCQTADYEGQAAMELEALLGTRPSGPARPRRLADARPRFSIDAHEGTYVLDPMPVLAHVVREVLAGAPARVVAADFHDAVARLVRDVVRAVRADEDVSAVGLTGGVFQNAVMTTQCRRLLEADGVEVLVHRRVPPNDGGLALGQVAVAAAGGGG